jgi:hypothetical protein
METRERSAIPIAEDDKEKPWAILGNNYEKRVLRRLETVEGVLGPSPGEEGLSEILAIAFLRGNRPEPYASQVNLRPRSRPKILEAAPGVELRRTYPDLIQRVGLGSETVFHLIDIKATRRATMFHKTQVAFYARMLETVLHELDVRARIDTKGSIWRIPDDGSAEKDEWTAEIFDLVPYLRLVDDFLGRILPGVAEREVMPGRDQTFFHVYFKCEQCRYLPHCGPLIQPGQSKDPDVSAVPGVTHETKRFFQRNGIRTVSMLAASSFPQTVDGMGWALARRAEALVERARALYGRRILRSRDGRTFLMPPRTEVAFHILADHDPVDDTLVTFGYLRIEGGSAREVIKVLPTADRGAEADALIEVFGALLFDLEEIDAANRANEGADGIYAHLFFYEPAEVVRVQEAVRRHLDDPRIRVGLLNIVRLFPPEDVIPEPEFRGVHHLPATPLRSVVEQLFALPVSVSYDLRQVSGVLAVHGHISRPYEPAPAFARPFSSMLSLDVSRDLREGRQHCVDEEEIRADVRGRLAVMAEIVAWLEREHRDQVASGGEKMLRLAKKPFRFHASFDPLAASDLDVLRAFELLENRAGLLETLIRLAQPLRVRRDSRRCLAGLTLHRMHRNGGEMVLVFEVPVECQDSEIRQDALGLILTDDDPDLRLDPSRWSSVQITLRGEAANASRLRVSMAARIFDGAEFQTLLRRVEGPNWCIDQIFVDLNSPRAGAFLEYLAEDAPT